MPLLDRKALFVAASMVALTACSNTSVTQAAAATSGEPSSASAKAGDSPRSVDAKTYCAKLQPAVQSRVKIPLSLFKADDSRSDDTYGDDPTYVSCPTIPTANA